MQAGSRGSLAVQLMVQNSTFGLASNSTNADGQSASGSGDRLEVVTRNTIYNGTTYDRTRSNIDTAALVTASGATTSQTGSDQTNYNGRAVKVIFDVTNAGTGSVTLTVQGKDAASGKYYTLLAGAAITTNSTNVYEIGPGLTAAANASANTILPRVWP